MADADGHAPLVGRDLATDLLTGAEAEQLTACAAQGCTRWFLCSHGARRWCTTRCGNRVRAARAYAAKRERAGE